MVEWQWDSAVPSPLSPVLTGLELMFMGLPGSNSGLLRPPGFIVSSVGKGERRRKKKKKRYGRKKEYKRVGRKQDGIKKERRTERKTEFMGKKIFSSL